MVVDVRGAVGAVVAVYGFACWGGGLVRLVFFGGGGGDGRGDGGRGGRDVPESP